MTDRRPWTEAEAGEAFVALAEALRQREPQPLALPSVGLRESAVLAPVRVQSGVPELVFTRRPSTFRHHAGQISFPGGVRDEHDTTAVATALRELEEELGVSRSAVQVLGLLDEIPTPTGFRIAPFVGRLAGETPLAPNETEVSEVIVLPLESLFAPGLPRIEQRQLFGQGRDVYFYELGPSVIWGATAHILRALLFELAKLPAWRRWTAP
jgi:8-oxo-dGTP pyrophosphatase MutT (NUDIX family)